MKLQVDKIEDLKVSIMGFSSSSSSGSSKRAKTPGGSVILNVTCLVDGCNSDLSQCREYHRRHKVCELHSKTPRVTIGGREQRFCQQCSRFHSLVEFDEGKRSCRKRLDGHNRRRRRPQSDSISRTSGMFLSSRQGTTILSFDSPQIHPSAVVSSGGWAGGVKPESETSLFNYHHHPPFNYIDGHNNIFPEAAHCYKGGGGEVNQFHFLQNNSRVLPPAAAAGAAAASDNRAGDSDRALSLLSSAPTHPQTRDMGSGQMVRPDSLPRSSQSLINNLQFGTDGLGQYHPFTHDMDSRVVTSDANGDDNSTTLQFQGMFHNTRDGSSASGSQQTLSFRWD